MEELRSTEILDKEIQEDARKKADRILKNADAEVEKIAAGVQVRLDATKAEKETYYKNLETAFERDLNAAYPLEKQRFLVEYQDRSMTDAISQYIDNLSTADKLALVQKMCLRCVPALTGKKVSAVVKGFDVKEIKKVLEANLEKGSLLSCEAAGETSEKYTGCILTSDDKAVRCRVTIEELIQGIVDANRYELVSTLFGGRLPS